VLVLLLAGAIGLAWLAWSPAGDDDVHPFNQDRNAVWLEHRWLEREHSRAEMETLLASLSGRGVAYAYPHLIPFNGAGRLPVHSREQMRQFLAVARDVAPGLKVLPWVGGLRVGYKRQRPGTIDLGDLGQRQSMVAECRGLMDEGFDGIHVNIEPVDDGNVEFLSLLRALRTAIGPGRVLSLSAIRPGPVRLPFAPNFLWTRGYYARVGEVADQVVVMAYDTALPTASLYRRYLSYVAHTVTSRLVSNGRTRVLVGIPTYDETGLMHRGTVETPENALLGLVAGLRGLGAGGTFEGVALYAEWTTDDTEWAVYDRLWRGRQALLPVERVRVAVLPLGGDGHLEGPRAEAVLPYARKLGQQRALARGHAAGAGRERAGRAAAVRDHGHVQRVDRDHLSAVVHQEHLDRVPVTGFHGLRADLEVHPAGHLGRALDTHVGRLEARDPGRRRLEALHSAGAEKERPAGEGGCGQGGGRGRPCPRRLRRGARVPRAAVPRGARRRRRDLFHDRCLG
jgi:hypothetical protein